MVVAAVAAVEAKVIWRGLWQVSLGKALVSCRAACMHTHTNMHTDTDTDTDRYRHTRHIYKDTQARYIHTHELHASHGGACCTMGQVRSGHVLLLTQCKQLHTHHFLQHRHSKRDPAVTRTM